MGRLYISKCKVILGLTQTVPLPRVRECQTLQNGTCRDRLLFFKTSGWCSYISVSDLPAWLFTFMLCSAVCLIYTNVICSPSLFSLITSLYFVLIFQSRPLPSHQQVSIYTLNLFLPFVSLLGVCGGAVFSGLSSLGAGTWGKDLLT